MPVLAVPYLVPFANAAGIVIGSVATAVGLSALSDKVQDYMEENPENSMNSFSIIVLSPASSVFPPVCLKYSDTMSCIFNLPA